MAIANAGFQPASVIPGSNPPRLITGRDALTIQGPTLMVEIGFNPDIFDTDPTKVQQALALTAAQLPSQQLVAALIDTGAYDSAVDDELAQQLKLPLIDQQDGSGIGGTEKFNVYLGHIRIAALGFVQYGRFMGVRLKAGKQPHQALLGRSLLKDMILFYDGRDGSVRIAV
jgi:predicted aspartyl protease